MTSLRTDERRADNEHVLVFAELSDRVGVLHGAQSVYVLQCVVLNKRAVARSKRTSNTDKTVLSIVAMRGTSTCTISMFMCKT